MGSALVAMAFEDAYLPVMHQDQKEFAGNREMVELKLQFKSTMPADPTEAFFCSLSQYLKQIARLMMLAAVSCKNRLGCEYVQRRDQNGEGDA